MTSDTALWQSRSARDHDCAAAVQALTAKFFRDDDLGASYAPAQLKQAIELMSVLNRYLSNAIATPGWHGAPDPAHRFELTCALTDMAYEQRRLYWGLARWAKQSHEYDELDASQAFTAAHRFLDARRCVAELGDALTQAHSYIGQSCDRACTRHEGIANYTDDTDEDYDMDFHDL
ncbi:hypothetical protein [Nocardia iowensis]|uniref:Uncharacterized protein n=1 Tax=Nocardia iowensis TaxID=204891 RepID=A0ABX8RSU1_NOCIO|nr:hypothetical protein [Nocardia iowensis]QXN91952.1 hypothetical protein KV110_01805 [Nocardia iowensis]